MAYEVFDDIAFFYLAISVVAMAVLPWSLVKLGMLIYESMQKPQLIPLTRIQKLKLAQQKAGVGSGADGSSSSSSAVTASLGAPVTVQPVGAGAIDASAAAKSNAAASGLVQENLRPPKPWLTCGNITLCLLWVLFLYMLIQIPSFSEQNLVSFKPYEILGLDNVKATDEEIKRAYRKQSLVYHPDRNPSPEAAQQFILVAKAYETLTDPKAKANIEKFGNPDGYQGTSITIGLPSWLTKKENEMRVLVVYFFIFIVLPPLIVWIWWRRAKDYVDGGLMKKSLGLWYQFMLPNMGSKFLIEYLSIAGENEVLLGPQYPTDITEFKKLATEVKSSMVKQRFQDPTKFGAYFQYSHKASVLLHAYLLRIPIPASMSKDISYILKDAHKFLGVLVELAISKGYLRTVFGLFDLMQLITQGCFPHDSPLLQLPYLTQEDVRKLNRKNIKTIHQLLKSPLDRLEKILPDFTRQQWNEIKSTGELIPDVEMKHEYAVEDEDGLFEGDLVTLKVKLDRVSFDPDKPEVENANYRLSQFEGDESTTQEETKEVVTKEAPKPEAASSSTKGKNIKNKRFANLGSGATEVEEVKEDGTPKAATDSTSTSEVELTKVGDEDKKVTTEAKKEDQVSPAASTLSPSPRPMTDDEILDSMPIPKPPKSIADIRASGPSVHSLTFPHPKHEKWSVLLIEKNPKKSDRLIAIQKVDSFFDEATTELKFYAPRSKSAKEDGLRHDDENVGVWTYEIHAICDSYIGVDQISTFNMKVDKPKGNVDEVAARVAEKVDEEYAELKEEDIPEEEMYGPWYYCYFPTFWELALNIFVLGLLCVFIFNFLMSRGYWQKYVWPLTEFVSRFTNPVVAFIYPYIAPVIEPAAGYFNVVYKFVSDMVHRDPFPKHPDDIQIDESMIPGMGQED